MGKKPTHAAALDDRPQAQIIASEQGRFRLYAVWGRPKSLRFGASQWEYLVLAYDPDTSTAVYVSSFAYSQAI